MGACLDLLRNAASFLGTEANGVSDNPLVIAEDGVALSGGNFHAEPVAFAADMIAMALSRDRLDRRAAYRHADRSSPLGAARIPHAQSRA